MDILEFLRLVSAAFGRLRVETHYKYSKIKPAKTAAFGRLRVETFKYECRSQQVEQPPSGGCVLKLYAL